jgi:hypothetical protein
MHGQNRRVDRRRTELSDRVHVRHAAGEVLGDVPVNEIGQIFYSIAIPQTAINGSTTGPFARSHLGIP